MTPLWQKKRLSRIRRRAIPEVQEAFARGDITPLRADILLYVEPTAQRQELARLLDEREASSGQP